MGKLASFWANLTPVSLAQRRAEAAAHAARQAEAAAALRAAEEARRGAAQQV